MPYGRDARYGHLRTFPAGQLCLLYPCPSMTSIAELLTRKERLLSRLEEYPGPNERDELERLLDKIDAELNALDRPDRL